jgi:hypothetical protein
MLVLMVHSAIDCLLLSQRNKASQNLEATQVMEVQMEHLFIQDLNLRLLLIK